MRVPFRGTGLVALVMVGCGARTDGLVGDFDRDPFASGADATTDDAGRVDSSRRDIGGTTEGGSGEVGPRVDGGPAVDASIRPDAGPAIEGCTPVLPRDGSACSPERTTCEYRGCHPSKKDVAQCIGRAWKVSAESCVSDPDRCPVGEPINRTACTFHADELCFYDAECTEQSVAQCAGGLWAVKHGGCPAPGFCPATMPAVGATCPKLPKGTGEGCSYVNACGLSARIICLGDSGKWGDLHDDPCTAPAPCPATEPAIGASCSGLTGTNCAWKNTCGSTDLMDCVSGKWRMFRRGKCVATGCPTTPTSGSACSSPGQSCTYPSGGGCSLVCECGGGAWTCKQPPCGEPTPGGK